MTDSTILPSEVSKAKINLETALMPWHELQRFFASGHVIQVADGINMVDVAYAMETDDVKQMQQWTDVNNVKHVSDEQALTWFEADIELWTLVVKPWILVQENKPQ